MAASASASTSLFGPSALTARLGAGRPSGGPRRRVDARGRGRLSVVAVQTGPQKPSPSPSPSSPAADEAEALQNLLKREYKYGFVSDFESFSIPKGLSEATVRRISELKAEPAWMLDFRLAAYRRFLTMAEPTWSDNVYSPVDLQSLCFYSAPKTKPKLNSLDEVDPELLKTFDRLGIPLGEQKRLSNVAVDAVIDSTSIATTHREALMAKGVIFCSISEAIPVFSDGSFCYVPKDTVCPMEISTY
uniref:Fe-S cluster assembly protein SufB n=1 Tax=Triticum urartu TaxID=4572 RepID=A0A8R7PX80_TRIUA